MATDDLTPFLVPPPDNSGVRYGQGKLISWNPTTFANEVAWKGATLRNLPVLAGPSALTFAPEQIVALIGWAPGGGAGSWAILGQWVTPGSGAAEEQVQFLQTSLASAIVDELVEQLLTSPAGQTLAAFVLAQRIHSETQTGSVFTSSTSFVSLTGGPTIADVAISDAGRAIVITTAHINHAASGSSESTYGGVMSFQVSGATSVSPADTLAVSAGGAKAAGVAGFDATWDRASSLSLVDGLNPGLHTFTARYRARDNNVSDAQFFNRNITVFAY